MLHSLVENPLSRGSLEDLATLQLAECTLETAFNGVTIDNVLHGYVFWQGGFLLVNLPLNHVHMQYLSIHMLVVQVFCEQQKSAGISPLTMPGSLMQP